MPANDRPVVSSVLTSEAGTLVLVGSQGRLAVADPETAAVLGLISGTQAGLVSGYVGTSATSIVAVRGSIFSEQGSAAQRSVVSSSVNDTSAGTGARTVRLTYYDGNMNGPFTEDITLNGTTAVNTVATNIRFVEALDVLTVGSNGVNAGNIDLTISTGGAGGSMARVNADEGRLYWCQHYVGAGRTAVIKKFSIGANGTSTQAWLRVAQPLTSNSFERQVNASLRSLTAQPTMTTDLSPLAIPGPARITAYVRPDSSTASTFYANLAFYEV